MKKTSKRGREVSSTRLARMIQERDAALIVAVRDDNFKLVKAYCKKYGVPIPTDEDVMKAGIYKAVQECIDIPESVKVMAMEKCIGLGFQPTIWGE